MTVQSYAEGFLTFRTPRRMLPPATPPFKSSTSHPGLLTSNDRITTHHIRQIITDDDAGDLLQQHVSNAAIEIQHLTISSVLKYGTSATGLALRTKS